MVSDSGIATCLDAKTGKEIWRERIGGKFSASPVLADERVYLLSEDGVGTVFQAARKYKRLATNSIEQRTLASYAIADGAIFIRGERDLFRIEASSGE